MQIVFQDPYGSLSPQALGRTDSSRKVCSSTTWAGMTPSVATSSRRHSTRSASIPRPRTAIPTSSRVVQRQRIAIARALALKPRFHGARRARPRPSICRSKPRSSSCCAISSAGHRLAYSVHQPRSACHPRHEPPYHRAARRATSSSKARPSSSSPTRAIRTPALCSTPPSGLRPTRVW